VAAIGVASTGSSRLKLRYHSHNSRGKSPSPACSSSAWPHPSIWENVRGNFVELQIRLRHVKLLGLQSGNQALHLLSLSSWYFAALRRSDPSLMAGNEVEKRLTALEPSIAADSAAGNWQQVVSRVGGRGASGP